MLILKVISRLLSYPEAELIANAGEISAAISTAKEIPPSLREQILEQFHALCEMDLMDAQEHYCRLFDHGRSLSLLIFEHVYGESRDRGQAMVDLMSIYEQNGFAMNVRELPDYLPLFLEYLSRRPEDEAREWLADVSHILGMLSARLQERNSKFHVLFDALLVISGAEVDFEELREVAASEERDDTMEALDKVWEAEQVRFGSGDSAASAGCRPQTMGKMPPRDSAQAIHWVGSTGNGANAAQR